MLMVSRVENSHTSTVTYSAYLTSMTRLKWKLGTASLALQHKQ